VTCDSYSSDLEHAEPESVLVHLFKNASSWPSLVQAVRLCTCLFTNCTNRHEFVNHVRISEPQNFIKYVA